MNGAPSTHTRTHTRTHTSRVKCHFLNVPSSTPARCCRSASCESCSCLADISLSICKYLPLLHDVDPLAHVSGCLLSGLQSEPFRSIPPSIPIFSLDHFPPLYHLASTHRAPQLIFISLFVPSRRDAVLPDLRFFFYSAGRFT